MDRSGQAAFIGHYAARTLFLVAAAVGVAACGDGSGGSGHWTGTVDTLSGGGLHVSNPAEPLWAEDQGWVLEEELRIGTMETDGPDLFGQIAALEVDSDGRIHVLERDAREVRVFGPQGEHLRTVGGRGGGPGEFADPVGMGWGEGGTLWVVDPGNGRYAVFDPEGSFLRSEPRPIGGYTIPWPGGFGPDGHVYDQTFVPGGQALVRFEPDLSRADTFPLPSYDSGEHFELRSNGNVMRASVPFTPGMRRALDPAGYLWSGITDRFRLVRTTLDGDTLLITERPVEPERVTTEDREQALEALEWFTRQGGEVDLRRIPSHRPVIGTLLVADDGHLWISPFTLSREGLARFDVLDPEGRYLGPVESDPAIAPFPPPLIRGDHLYAVVQDELEVPYVTRFRVVR